MYLIYLKDYKDIEQEKPANVPQAWCEEPLTKLDALPAPLRVGGGDTTPLSYQISISTLPPLSFLYQSQKSPPPVPLPALSISPILIDFHLENK